MPRSQYCAFINGLSLVGLVACLACTPTSKPGEARVRIGQFLWTTEQATVSWYRNDELVTSATLAYGELSDYQLMEANTYWVKIMADDTLVLEKEIGLGTGGLYTAVLTGIPEKNQPVNKKSIGDQLHYIVEGAAAITANSYLPQLIIENDFFVPEPQKGTLRWVSLMPGTVPLDLELTNDGQLTASVSDLAYPRNSDTQTAKPGEYNLAIHLNGRSATADAMPVHVEEKTLHTYFLIPNEGHYLTTPRVVEGTTQQPD